VDSAKALALVRTNGRQRLLNVLRTPVVTDAAKWRSRRIQEEIGPKTAAIDDSIRVATQRRASSDELEKQLSQNETGRRQSKFRGARKTPAESNARARNLLAR
jgi:hypothetical protein